MQPMSALPMPARPHSRNPPSSWQEYINKIAAKTNWPTELNEYRLSKDPIGKGSNGLVFRASLVHKSKGDVAIGYVHDVFALKITFAYKNHSQNGSNNSNGSASSSGGRVNPEKVAKIAQHAAHEIEVFGTLKPHSNVISLLHTFVGRIPKPLPESWGWSDVEDYIESHALITIMELAPLSLNDVWKHRLNPQPQPPHMAQQQPLPPSSSSSSGSPSPNINNNTDSKSPEVNSQLSAPVTPGLSGLPIIASNSTQPSPPRQDPLLTSPQPLPSSISITTPTPSPSSIPSSSGPAPSNLSNDLRAIGMLSSNPNDTKTTVKRSVLIRSFLIEEDASDHIPLSPAQLAARALNIQLLFSGRELMMIIRQLSDALCHLYRSHISHRDLKLDNILIRAPAQLFPTYKILRDIERKGIEICLADFGECYSFRNAKHGAMKDYFKVHDSRGGAPAFMAPEVKPNPEGRVVDYSRADVWSVGLMVLRLMTADSNLSHEQLSTLDFLNEYDEYQPVLRFLSLMLKVDPRERISPQDLSDQAWGTVPLEIKGYEPKRLLDRGATGCTYLYQRRPGIEDDDDDHRPRYGGQKKRLPDTFVLKRFFNHPQWWNESSREQAASFVLGRQKRVCNLVSVTQWLAERDSENRFAASNAVIMEHCYGTLDEWFGRRLGKINRSQRYPLFEHELVNLAIQLIGGLEELHKLDLVHGDIHPGNIFVSIDSINDEDDQNALIVKNRRRGRRASPPARTFSVSKGGTVTSGSQQEAGLGLGGVAPSSIPPSSSSIPGSSSASSLGGPSPLITEDSSSNVLLNSPSRPSVVDGKSAPPPGQPGIGLGLGEVPPPTPPRSSPTGSTASGHTIDIATLATPRSPTKSKSFQGRLTFKLGDYGRCFFYSNDPQRKSQGTGARREWYAPNPALSGPEADLQSMGFVLLAALCMDGENDIITKKDKIRNFLDEESGQVALNNELMRFSPHVRELIQYMCEGRVLSCGLFGKNRLGLATELRKAFARVPPYVPRPCQALRLKCCACCVDDADHESNEIAKHLQHCSMPGQIIPRKCASETDLDIAKKRSLVVRMVAILVAAMVVIVFLYLKSFNNDVTPWFQLFHSSICIAFLIALIWSWKTPEGSVQATTTKSFLLVLSCLAAIGGNAYQAYKTQDHDTLLFVVGCVTSFENFFGGWFLWKLASPYFTKAQSIKEIGCCTWGNKEEEEKQEDPEAVALDPNNNSNNNELQARLLPPKKVKERLRKGLVSINRPMLYWIGVPLLISIHICWLTMDLVHDNTHIPDTSYEVQDSIVLSIILFRMTSLIILLLSYRNLHYGDNGKVSLTIPSNPSIAFGPARELAKHYPKYPKCLHSVQIQRILGMLIGLGSSGFIFVLNTKFSADDRYDWARACGRLVEDVLVIICLASLLQSNSEGYRGYRLDEDGVFFFSSAALSTVAWVIQLIGDFKKSVVLGILEIFAPIEILCLFSMVAKIMSSRQTEFISPLARLFVAYLATQNMVNTILNIMPEQVDPLGIQLSTWEFIAQFSIISFRAICFAHFIRTMQWNLTDRAPPTRLHHE